MNGSVLDVTKRFLKFAVVGSSGVLVNLGIYWLMSRGLDLRHNLWAENAAYAFSVEISIITNFLLNDLWTFRDRRSASPFTIRFYRFHMVSFVGFGINWGAFALINWMLHKSGLVLLGNFEMLGRTRNIDDLIAACIGIGAAMSWNFAANLLWTWKENR